MEQIHVTHLLYLNKTYANPLPKSVKGSGFWLVRTLQ